MLFHQIIVITFNLSDLLYMYVSLFPSVSQYIHIIKIIIETLTIQESKIPIDVKIVRNAQDT